MTVFVEPGSNAITHDGSLSDGNREYGYRLAYGPQSVQEIPATPQNILPISQNQQFGTGDPAFTEISQDDWIDGICQEYRDVRQAGYWRGQNCWTLTPGKAMPAPLHQWADGLIETYEWLPQHGNGLTWQPLYGGTRYIEIDFTTISAFAADNAAIYLRRVGAPPDATIKICTDSGGDPSTVVTDASATVGISTITDYVSQFYVADLSAAANLSTTTKYHLVIDGGAGSSASHWEVGVDVDNTGSQYSSDEASWSSATYKLYHRIFPTKINRKWKFFNLYELLMAVDCRRDNTESTLLFSGEIGVITAGDATTATDSNEGMDGSWTTDQWIGWRIKLRDSNGLPKGTSRTITANTDAGVITVSSAWDINPAAGDIYVIYGKAEFQALATGTTGLGVVKDVTVNNNVAYFAQGAGDNVIKIYYAQASHGFVYGDNGAVKADLLLTAVDSTDGPVVWRALNDLASEKTVVSYAKKAAKTSSLSFKTDIEVGDPRDIINEITIYGNDIIICKEGGVYKIVNNKAESYLEPLSKIVYINNGIGAIEHNGLLYIPWGKGGLVQCYSGSISNVEPKELSNTFVGDFTSLTSRPGVLYGAVDAGTGTSAIYAMEDTRLGWHEVFRAFQAGQRIETIYWEKQEGIAPRLWISIGGDIMYLEFPTTNNPEKDANHKFHHEAVIDFSTADLQAASMKKYFHDFLARCWNLNNNVKVYLDYKINENVDDETTEWKNVGAFTSVPLQELPIHVGDVDKIRIRLRMCTNNHTIPPIVDATVLQGFARFKEKYQYRISIVVESNQRDYKGNLDPDPDERIAAFKKWAEKATVITHRSKYQSMHERAWILKPFAIRRFKDDNTGRYGAYLDLSVIEA